MVKRFHLLTLVFLYSTLQQLDQTSIFCESFLVKEQVFTYETA